MKIAFVDLGQLAYSPLTPYERPLGGTESAVCYLASELARNGHEIALVNRLDGAPGAYAGVVCPGAVDGFKADFLNSFDSVVALNRAQGIRLRTMNVTTRMVLWSQHAANETFVASLRDATERASWNAFALVSDWQAESYVEAFGIDRDRISVKRNAASPPFESVERSGLPFFRRDYPPVLAYTSTPNRGLEKLLLAFPTIRRLVPGCRLKVFSSMKTYQARDRYRVLYDLCAALPGVDYVGSVSQKALAEELRGIDILSYPNTFPETSCIAVMEAMAAGCLVLTSTLGALPETTAGYGLLLPPGNHGIVWASDYAQMVGDVIQEARKEPDKVETLLRDQTAHARANYTWKNRAREWAAWLSGLQSGAPGKASIG